MKRFPNLNEWQVFGPAVKILADTFISHQSAQIWFSALLLLLAFYQFRNSTWEVTGGKTCIRVPAIHMGDLAWIHGSTIVDVWGVPVENFSLSLFFSPCSPSPSGSNKFFENFFDHEPNIHENPFNNYATQLWKWAAGLHELLFNNLKIDHKNYESWIQS